MSAQARRAAVVTPVVKENYLLEPRRQCLAQVMGAGRVRNQNVTIQQRRMGYHVLVLIERGHGWFTSASCPQRRVGPGQILLLFPGEEHTYGPDAGGWDELWVSACGSLFRALENERVITRANPVFDCGLDPMLVESLARLVDDVLTRTSEPALLAARTHLVMVQAATVGAQRCVWHDVDGVVARAQALLGTDLGRTIEAEDLENACGQSYDRVRKLFSDATGMPPARWRRERRMNEAKRLLADPKVEISSIATRLGFADRAHFGHRFCALVGVSPGAWRCLVLGRNP